MQSFTPESRTATPLAFRVRFRHCFHHSNHPLAHWLALLTPMHRAVCTPTTYTTLPPAWLTLVYNMAAHVRRHGTSLIERWMSWPIDTEQTMRRRTNSLQAHAKRKRSMHRPSKGQGPAYSIFGERNAPKPRPPRRAQAKRQLLPAAEAQRPRQPKPPKRVPQGAAPNQGQAKAPNMPEVHTTGKRHHAPRIR